MRNELPPFGERGTASLSGRFRRARLSLTMIYATLLFLILTLSGGITYGAFSQRLEYRYESFRAHRSVVVVETGAVNPTEVRRDLFDALLAVNAVLLLSAGVLSYHLAGWTLRPIQAAYERQRQFLSDASHELRTPLAILQTDLENSRTTNPDAESHLEEVQRMGRLVNDLLALSRLDEEAAAKRPMELVDVAAAAREAVDRLRSMAEKSGIALQYEGASDFVVMALVDRELLQQALSNVIRNAIAYNKENGAVTVATSVDRNKVAIRITDTGIGIAEEDVKKIFDRFYRVDKSRSRAHGGSGLGLAIVRSILEYFGGTVQVTSVLHEGTTVTLILPLQKAS